MSFFTAPPNLAFGPKGDVPGCQRAVGCGVPLRSQIGKTAGQIVYPWDHKADLADRTAAAVYPCLYLRLPLMALLAAPPHLPVAAGEYLARGERSVSGRVPLGGQLRP